MRSNVGAHAGFIKSNVTISSNAEYLEIDASCLFDLVLVGRAVTLNIVRCHHPLWNVNVLWVYIDMIKKVRVHELPVALWMFPVDTDIFIEIEGDDVPKR